MRLLHTQSLEFEVFVESEVPEYAILSHTWEQEEVEFQDMADISEAKKKHGFKKIRRAASLAKSHGYTYIWIDTCCIDKSSSAELTEAINSMFRWYKDAEVCYAFLSDVQDMPQTDEYEFRHSRWFTRGWTLQELIAPDTVVFYSTRWEEIGNKHEDFLCSLVSKVTGIDQHTLRGQDPADISIARRMYWASKRQTTRVEDLAYSLLGLFDVNMPMIYGEGLKAFRRLQEEILKTTDDQSIFAWHNKGFSEGTPVDVLAQSPSDFAESGTVSPQPFHRVGRKATSITNQGIAIEFPIMSLPAPVNMESEPFTEVEAILDCQLGSAPGTFPTIRLRCVESKRDDGRKHYYRVMTGEEMTKVQYHDNLAFVTDVEVIGFDPTQLHKEAYRNSVDKYNWSWKVELVTITRKLPKIENSGDDSVRIPWSLSLLRGEYPSDDTPFWLLTYGALGTRSNIGISIDDVYPQERWDASLMQLRVAPIPRKCLGEGWFCRIEGIFEINMSDLGTILEGLPVLITLLVGRQSNSRREPHPKPWCRLLEKRIDIRAAEDFMDKYNNKAKPFEDEAWESVHLKKVGGCQLKASVRVKEISGFFYYVVALRPLTVGTQAAEDTELLLLNT
ncbi:heterokaryon incompatibility protein-domain-containing protein [Hypoxylon crocopeplum]|nr:heterokaryon incompatibility protein-domain-containing protein [Hypoxylon crocopeplum]